MLRPARSTSISSPSRRRRSRHFPRKRWTLEEFVAVEECEFASRAAWAVIHKPSSLRGPLLLCGPAGVGKTHLARGLAIQYAERSGQQRTAALSVPDYAEDVAKAARRNELASLRGRYVPLELLVLDGLESVAGKGWLQQELLHTLELRRARGVTTVLTARMPPAKLNGLSPRLQGRLACGITVPMGLPGEPSRRRLLQVFSDRLQISLSPDVAQILSAGIPGSARDLLDAITVLNAAAEEMGGPLTRELAKRYVAVQGSHGGGTRLSTIAETVAAYFDVTVSELVSQRRNQPVTRGRQVAIFLARELTSRSLVEIGRFFGGRDHSTILYSSRRIAQARGQDRALDTALNQIREALSSRT